MRLGTCLLWLALIFTSGTAVVYLMAARQRSTTRLHNLGRGLYVLSVAVITAMAAIFLGLILKNDFSIRYVALNSSKDLPLNYKVSVFWAQQQGSFLFWAFCSGILGLWVMRKAGEFETWVMVIWATMQALFIVLLLSDSPFLLLSVKDQMSYFGVQGIPLDGFGLRELLQNPWMAIHPPLVFIGYSAMSIPAAFAIAALVKGDFTTWCRTTLGWAILGWVTLGTGIILGAYWAYEVLGWGGYWGWDPVENASLVPWILGTALVHGMVAERYRGSFKRANFVLALITMLTVFDATFLTRSNVLGTDLFGNAVEGSVHTFGDAAIGQPIIWFMRALTVLSLLLLTYRWKKISSEKSYRSVKSKDYAFYLGTVIFLLAAALVLVGTSLPIIGKMVGGHVPSVQTWTEAHPGLLSSFLTGKIKLDQAFYNPVMAPIGFLLLMLLAISPVLAWRRGKEKSEGEGAGIIIAAVAIGLPFLALRFGNSSIVAFSVGIVLAALSALVINAWSMIKAGKQSLRMVGGHAAHVGVAVMCLGFVLSANGGKPAKVSLNEGRAGEITLSEMGLPSIQGMYRVTYEGNQKLSDRKFGAKIRLDGDGKVMHALPILQITRENQLLQMPYIAKSFVRDIYIAPQSIPAMPSIGVLEQGVPQQLDDKGSTLTLRAIEVLPSKGGENEARVAAKLVLKAGGKSRTLAPCLIMRQTGKASGPAIDVPGMPTTISLDSISVEDHAVYVTLTTDGAARQLKLIRRKQAELGNYKLLFRDWFFSADRSRVGAEIEVKHKGESATVTPMYSPHGQPRIETESKPVLVPNLNATIALMGVDIDSNRAQIAMRSTTADIDISVKPFISLVWIGAVIALLGGSMAMWRRMSETNTNTQNLKPNN